MEHTLISRVAMQNKETKIQNEILIALGTLPGMAIWRAAVGNGWVRTKDGYKPMRFGGLPGQADIICCYWGRFVAVEVKTPTGRQRKEQIDWQRAIEAAGGVYILARSADEALTAIQRINLPTTLLQMRQSDAIPTLPVGAADGPPVRLSGSLPPSSDPDSD